MSTTLKVNDVNLKNKTDLPILNENLNARVTYKISLSEQMDDKCSITNGKNKIKNFTIRKLTVQDTEDILKFLNRFFFRDEPMNMILRLLPTPDARCDALEQFALSSIADNLSVGAYSNDGELIGLLLNGLSRREEQANMEELVDSCSDPKFKRILKVLTHLDKNAKVWELYNYNKILDIKIASTHSEWRGQGLMKCLIAETENIARLSGAGALRIDTTSKYSSAASERLNFKKIYSVAYEDLKDAPQPCSPHRHACVYIKQLD